MPVTYVVNADTGSNKPGKVPVQSIGIAYSHVRPNKFHVLVLKPKVDRLSVTLQVDAPESRKAILNHLLELETTNSSNVTKWHKHKDWGAAKYHSAFAIHLGQERTALLQAAAINAAIPFLRFELNPAAIEPPGVDAFREINSPSPCVTHPRRSHKPSHA